MRKPKRIVAAVLAGLLCLTLSGCATSVAENTEIYFTQVSSILGNLFSGGGNTAKTPTAAPAGVPLDAPGGFTVDENGDYAFSGVEGAQYYLLYFCAPDATADGDTYLYASSPIEEDGSGVYAGNTSELFQYSYGEYLVKVFAFPDLTDTEHTMSTAAVDTYRYGGELRAPELYYYWNTFDQTMGVQVANMDAYLYEIYPDRVDITFTNVENSADVVELAIEPVSEGSFSAQTDALTPGATYTVTAVASSGSEFVSNAVSAVTTVSEAMTLGADHLYTDGYTYSDGFVLLWPVVCRLNPAEGGLAGMPVGTYGPYQYLVTPVETTAGSAYSYALTVNVVLFGASVEGTLELYEDGTFLMAETGGGPRGMIPPSSISGIWHDNGDGTVTMSYDHSSVTIS